MSETFNVEEYVQSIKDASATVTSKIAGLKPRVMIICGSGLGGIVNILKEQIELKYEDIPGFKTSTVSGHAGKLVFGTIGSNKVPVMCMVGRLHFYEGYSLQDTTFPVRLAKEIGIETIVVTNAAGGVNSDFKVGDLMLINDHINLAGFAGFNPLRGPNLKPGPRFLPLSDAYDFDLRRLFFNTKRELGIERTVHEGVYFFAAGPTYESRAEVRMIKTLGGDAVGMSTVPEVVVARHCGLKVLALSLITNVGVDAKPPSALTDEVVKLDAGMANHQEVLDAANEASKDVQKIFEATINKL